MSMITPMEFMKFCMNQGFEFVMDNGNVINKDNVDELFTFTDNKLIPLSMRKTKEEQICQKKKVC